MGIGVVAKNHLQTPSTMFLQQTILKITISRSFIRFNISYVIHMSFACHLHAPVFYLYLRVSHSYVSRMEWYVICMSLLCTRMSLVCTCMSSVCQQYVLVCHQYVTCMYSYVIRMSLICGSTMNSSVVLSIRIFCTAFICLVFEDLLQSIYF